jgi:hypothetical protein
LVVIVPHHGHLGSSLVVVRRSLFGSNCEVME